MKGLTLALVGDVISGRPLEPHVASDPAFARVVEILRASEATFGNLEAAIVDVRFTQGEPHGWGDDMAGIAEPAVARDLRALGFDLLGRANNHSMDWGAGGLRETGRFLDAAGLVHAGAGETLSAARSPRFLDASSGRVGLVSLTTSPASPIAPALDAFGEVPSRPGVNEIHAIRTVVVPARVMDSLSELAAVVPELDTSWFARGDADAPRALELSHTRFIEGEGFEERFDLDAEATAANAGALRLAGRHADVVVAAMHIHQGDRRPEQPLAMVTELASSAVEAGAHVVAISGPHHLGPVQVLEGRPVFYGLGNFVWDDMQSPLQRYLYEITRQDPSENRESPITDADVIRTLSAGFVDEEFLWAIVAQVRFEGDEPAEVRLHPIEIAHKGHLPSIGMPRIPGAATAERILEHVQGISEPLGTTIEIRDQVGSIRLG